MNLQEKIHSDSTQALRDHDDFRCGVLRMILSSLQRRGIEKRTREGTDVLSEDEVILLLRSEIKKRKESAELFQTGGRNELAEKELAEIKVIEVYLPPELSEEEIEVVVSRVIKKTGAIALKQMGLVMKEVMNELGSRADGSAVSSCIRKKLSA